MDTQTLKEILRREMMGYAKKGANGAGYFTVNPDDTVFGVLDVYVVHGERYADASLIARIIDNRVIIELDKNDKTLFDALLQAGVPREQIVLAYAGEPAPVEMLV